MLRLSIIALLFLAMVAGAVVWSNKGQGPAADFTYICRGDNKTLDIGVMSWLQDIRVAYCLWEGLYTPDPVTMEPVPGTADRVQISPDKTVYTFHIRDTARWSNGAAVTAGDFAFGWRRMLEQPAEYSYLYGYIKGARDYENDYEQWKKTVAEGKSLPPPDFRKVGIEAVDSRTFRVTLEQPVPYFLAICAFAPFFPQYEPCMRPFAQWDPTGTYVAAYDQGFTRPPHLVTNGPYKLTSWLFKRSMRFEANPYYWDRANVKSKVIEQLNIDDALAAYRVYESGEADWLPELDDDLSADLHARHRTDLKLFPSFGTYFYDFNCHALLPDGSKNPFADRRVRRAFVMALDKQPIVQNVTRGGEPVSTTLIPVGSIPGYQSPPGLPYNVAEARRLLAEAGFPGGAGFPSHLHIVFNNDFPSHGQIAQVVRRQWETNLGVQLELEGVEIKVFGDRLHNHEFAVGRASWFGDYEDPSTFTDLFQTGGNNNDPDYANPAYDALLRQAASQIDPRERLKILERAENLVLEDAPIMPIYQYVGSYLVHDNTHGVSLNPRHMVMLQAVKVDR